MFDVAHGQDDNILENKTRHLAAAQVKRGRLTVGKSFALGDSHNVALGSMLLKKDFAHPSAQD